MHATPPRPVPRNVRLDPSVVIPRHWFGGLPLATHIANGVNLLFPAGERFFVRSVRHFVDRLDDPELLEQIRGFAGQEGRHARAHEELFATLESQGLRVKPFLAAYERVAFRWIEPVASPELRLAVTAALEHFTAIMAENALRERLLDRAHPELRALLLWHAVEEIEHKAVAFDVLQRVAPSYLLRLRGLALAALGLAVFWFIATRMLLRQDRALPPDHGMPVDRELIDRRRSIALEVFLRGIFEFAKPGFHPWNNDNLELARSYVREAGLDRYLAH